MDNLHPNWQALHLTHIHQLELMVKRNGPQTWEAKRLLAEAKAEYERLLIATGEKRRS